MRFRLLASCLLMGVFPAVIASGHWQETPPTYTGLDVLMMRDVSPLQGKRIGLITHRAGVTFEGKSAIDVLANAPEVKLVALFAPEHGIRGATAAGEKVSDTRDTATGLPIYSLYGSTRKPTARMLRGVDALVFNLQDVGVRSYTYLSTLGLCMEAAAENGLEFIVLDRPNPLGGNKIEGNLPSSAFRSFVGRYPVPYVHGMTFGELARMINAQGWLAGKRACKLTVVPMQGWRRNMMWEPTGRAWIPTSPNVPTAETPRFLAATGIAGELPALDVGVRTATPFTTVGAPGLNADALATTLNSRNLNGVSFQAANWVARHGAYKGSRCQGVRIQCEDAAKSQLTRINFEIIDAVRRQKPSLRLFPPARARMFDLVCGTDAVRKGLAAGQSPAALWQRWNRGSDTFQTKRKPYLLYP